LKEQIESIIDSHKSKSGLYFDNFIQVLILLLLNTALLFTVTDIHAQNTSISGVINDYTNVSAVSGNNLIVGSSLEFSVGDRVLIIQMQGAVINENNSSSFGDPIDLGSSGNYEFATICAIPNNNEILTKNIQRSYDPSGALQIIRVPVYDSATTTGILTAMPWNGSIGGVLVFECTSTFTMNDDIYLKGTGLHGGIINTSTYSCQWFLSASAYHYDLSLGQGANKGEGIASYISGKTAGRGDQLNGGGGGNDHKSGGGGGGNAGAGGVGGHRIASTSFNCSGTYPGVGGNSLSYSNADNRIFFGGGGGAGHENTLGLGTSGSNGGGIVIIRAQNFVAQGQTINVDAASTPGNSYDGAGGGGAGGTVLLDVGQYTGQLIINANGTDGGSVDNSGPSNCNGPGGGGGGGLLWVNQSALSGGIVLNNSGGQPGITVTTFQNNCTVNSNNFALPGESGSLLTDLVLFESDCGLATINQSTTICPLDSFYVGGAWQYLEGVYIDTVTSFCCDTIYTTTLSIGPLDVGVVQNGATLSANLTGADYQWLDCGNNLAVLTGETSQSFTPSVSGNYAVENTLNGCTDTSGCILVDLSGLIEMYEDIITVHPNPTSDILTISGLNEVNGLQNMEITSSKGEVVMKINGTDQEINVSLLPVGVYFLNINHEQGTEKIRFVKQ